MKILLVLIIIFLTITSPIEAHRDGCHAKHSCPSDSGSYICGDTGNNSECGTTEQATEPVEQYTAPVITSAPTSIPTKIPTAAPTSTPTPTVKPTTEPTKESTPTPTNKPEPVAVAGDSTTSDEDDGRSAGIAIVGTIALSGLGYLGYRRYKKEKKNNI